MTGAPLINQELRAWVGRTTRLKPLVLLSASDVRRYVDATGDANPLWLDDEYARYLGHPGRLLPPILVGWVPFSLKELEARDELVSFDLRRQLPLPPNYTNVRNAGSETEWLKPVYLGEQLSSRSRIVDMVVRQGKLGEGIYVTQEEEISNPQGEILFRRRHTMALFPAQEFGDRKSSHEEQ